MAGCATGCEAGSTSTCESGSGLPGGAPLDAGSQWDDHAEDACVWGSSRVLQSADRCVVPRWCEAWLALETALTSDE